MNSVSQVLRIAFPKLLDALVDIIGRKRENEEWRPPVEPRRKRGPLSLHEIMRMS